MFILQLAAPPHVKMEAVVTHPVAAFAEQDGRDLGVKMVCTIHRTE
jgi:hypothetical protein